ncbi:unnamed protein product, partial [Vitis vinifera]
MGTDEVCAFILRSLLVRIDFNDMNIVVRLESNANVGAYIRNDTNT